MLIFWTWIIEKLNLFNGFSESDINRSFVLPVLLTYIIIFIVIFLFIPTNDDDYGTWYINKLFSTIIISSVITLLLYFGTIRSHYFDKNRGNKRIYNDYNPI